MSPCAAAAPPIWFGTGRSRLIAGFVVDPALWELLRAEAGTDGDRVLEAIIRLARPGIEIPDVRMVSRFGTIATCRIRARDVIARPSTPPTSSASRRRASSARASRPLSPRPIRSARPSRTCARPISGAPRALADRGGRGGGGHRLGSGHRLGRVPVARGPARRTQAGPRGHTVPVVLGSAGSGDRAAPGARTGTGASTAGGDRPRPARPTALRTAGISPGDRGSDEAAVRTAPAPWISRPATARPTGRRDRARRGPDLRPPGRSQHGRAGQLRRLGAPARGGRFHLPNGRVAAVRHQHQRRPAMRSPRRHHAGGTRVRRAAGRHARPVHLDSAGNYFRWRAHSCGTIGPGESSRSPWSWTRPTHPQRGRDLVRRRGRVRRPHRPARLRRRPSGAPRRAL